MLSTIIIAIAFTALFLGSYIRISNESGKLFLGLLTSNIMLIIGQACYENSSKPFGSFLTIFALLPFFLSCAECLKIIKKRIGNKK